MVVGAPKAGTEGVFGMGTWQEIDLSILGVFLCGALAFGGFIMTLRWVLVRGFGFAALAGAVYTYKEACAAANQFINKLNRVRSKITLLEPYTAEYVHVFQSAGWVHIMRLFESLELAEAELDRRIKEREYDSAVALAEFLCTHDTVVADDFISQDGFRFVSLVLWEKQLLEHLNALLDELKDAAEGMQDIGLVRKRERAPTLLTVEAIRHELLELQKEWSASL